MAMRPSTVMDPTDCLRVEEAVLSSERATAGEISVVVVDACDAYTGASWRAGVLLAGLALAALALAAPGLPAWALLGAQAAGLATGHAACRVRAVRRHFVADSQAEARVVERARRAFAEQGLARADGHGGILLFAALLERRVVILADRGIHEAVAADAPWAGIAARAVRGLAEGRRADALVEAVEACGRVLTRHLPGPPREAARLPAALAVEEPGA